MKHNIEQSLSKAVYRHYNIKLNIPPVYIGCHKLADRISTSIGIPYMNRIFGKKRTAILLEAAMNYNEQVYTIKLRGGGRLRFYAK